MFDDVKIRKTKQYGNTARTNITYKRIFLTQIYVIIIYMMTVYSNFEDILIIETLGLEDPRKAAT